MANTFNDINDLKTSSMDETVHGQEPQAKRNDSLVEGQVPQEVAPKRSHSKKDRKKVTVKYFQKKDEPGKGIGPKSPTIYLLPEEKTFLDRLKAFILLETGEKMTDHGLVMKALMEYADRHYEEFSKNHKV